jgi:hypothetical protein
MIKRIQAQHQVSIRMMEDIPVTQHAERMFLIVGNKPNVYDAHAAIHDLLVSSGSKDVDVSQGSVQFAVPASRVYWLTRPVDL